MSHRNRILALVLVAVGLPIAGRLVGQEPATDTPAVTEPAAAKTDDTIREQAIYIPYDKLQKVFEKEGRGVFLPYEKFQALWNAARAQTKAAQPPKRPVDALINSIENEATIADQVVNVSATLQLEILGEGWVTIPLRLGQSAIRSAQINGQPARLVFNPDTGHQLLYQKQGDQPLQLELKLEYTRAFTKTPGQSSVSFEAPQAPINRWTVHVPEAGMAVQIEPMIAATHAPADGAGAESKQTDLLSVRRCRAHGPYHLEPQSRRGERAGGFCHGAGRTAIHDLRRGRPQRDQIGLRHFARHLEPTADRSSGRPESGECVRPQRQTLERGGAGRETGHSRRAV